MLSPLVAAIETANDQPPSPRHNQRSSPGSVLSGTGDMFCGKDARDRLKISVSCLAMTLRPMLRFIADPKPAT